MAKKSMIVKQSRKQNLKYVNILVALDVEDLIQYLENMEFVVFALEN